MEVEAVDWDKIIYMLALGVPSFLIAVWLTFFYDPESEINWRVIFRWLCWLGQHQWVQVGYLGEFCQRCGKTVGLLIK